MNSRLLVLIATGATMLVIISVTYVVIHRNSDVPPSPPTAVPDDDRRAIEEGDRLRRAASNPAPPKGKVIDPFSLGHDSNATTQP